MYKFTTTNTKCLYVLCLALIDMGKTQTMLKKTIEVQHMETYGTEILLSLIMLGLDAINYKDRSG